MAGPRTQPASTSGGGHEPFMVFVPNYEAYRVGYEEMAGRFRPELIRA